MFRHVERVSRTRTIQTHSMVISDEISISYNISFLSNIYESKHRAAWDGIWWIWEVGTNARNIGGVGLSVSYLVMRPGVFANKKGEGQRIGHYHILEMILDMGAVSGTYGHGCIWERHTHFF